MTAPVSERLVLDAGIATAIIEHARAGYPDEVCGIVGGRGGRGWLLYLGRNVAPHPRISYELDVDTLSRQIELEAAGLELAAIYHSHPHGPEMPSATDIGRAFYPDAVYIICNLADRDKAILRGYRIRDGRAWEVALA